MFRVRLISRTCQSPPPVPSISAFKSEEEYLINGQTLNKSEGAFTRLCTCAAPVVSVPPLPPVIFPLPLPLLRSHPFRPFEVSQPHETDPHFRGATCVDVNPFGLVYGFVGETGSVMIMHLSERQTVEMIVSIHASERERLFSARLTHTHTPRKSHKSLLFTTSVWAPRVNLFNRFHPYLCMVWVHCVPTENPAVLSTLLPGGAPAALRGADYRLKSEEIRLGQRALDLQALLWQNVILHCLTL